MDETSKQIIAENIKLHRIEAAHYEQLHPEEFNWFEQRHIQRDLMSMCAKLASGIRVLDIGCGTGNITLKLLALGCEVHGVDVSSDMLEVLKTKVAERYKNQLKLSCENIDDFLSRSSLKFHLVTVSSALHHFPDYTRVLKQVFGFIETGGYLYIVHEPTQYALSPDRFLRKILWQVDNLVHLVVSLGRIPRVGGRDYHLSDYHVYHGFSETLVRQICSDAGLVEEKFEYYASAMRCGLSCWIDAVLLKTKSQFCLIAQKLL